MGKPTLLFLLVAVTGFAAARSPLLLIAVPSLAFQLALDQQDAALAALPAQGFVRGPHLYRRR